MDVSHTQIIQVPILCSSTGNNFLYMYNDDCHRVVFLALSIDNNNADYGFAFDNIETYNDTYRSNTYMFPNGDLTCNESLTCCKCH